MAVSLKILTGARAGQVLVIDSDKFLIGREADCHFRSESNLVSRHHCVIKTDEFASRIRDLGSRNGTFVNGKQIHGEVVLADGDNVLVGDTTLQIVLHADAAPSSDQPPMTQSVDTNIDTGATAVIPVPSQPTGSPQPPPSQPPVSDASPGQSPPPTPAELLQQHLQKRETPPS